MCLCDFCPQYVMRMCSGWGLTPRLMVNLTGASELA